MAQIILDHVEKAYPGGVKAVDGLSLDIQDGEFMVLVGPSGCGKSTALRSIAGLEEITGGTISIGDRIVNDLPPKDRDIAMVFQNYALYPHMTVEQNLAFGLQLRKTPKDEIKRRVGDAAKMLGLEPYLGTKRLDKLQVKDIRLWLNKLAQVCQCCAQGKDAARAEDKRRCCAIGQCCHAALSARSRADARDTLRAALTCAVEEEIIARNPVAVVRLPASRKRKRRWWTVDEARQFLESSRRDQESLYAAFVLILVLGLRKGEVLGLTWELVNLDDAELYVSEQVQRVGKELLRRQVKTETSEAPLPLPELCVAALKLRRDQQDADRGRAAGKWVDTGLVFTTRHGTAVEPRNFSRSFDRCIRKARVPRITVHGTRKTCGSLLAALDVHPRVAMQILRHSKIAVTMEIYTEVPSAATRAALRKLGQWLGS